jgi:hypothetical protein
VRDGQRAQEFVSVSNSVPELSWRVCPPDASRRSDPPGARLHAPLGAGRDFVELRLAAVGHAMIDEILSNQLADDL